MACRSEFVSILSPAGEHREYFQWKSRARLEVPHLLTREMAYGREHATCNHFALDACEPDLGLVEPRGASWRKVELNVGVFIEEGFDLLSLVRGQIIQNDVNLALGLA